MRLRAIRRNDHTPRVEMLPLIDVVFLLLTFFIYSLVMMHYLHVVPISLAGPSQASADIEQDIYAITLDRHGRVMLNDEPVDDAALDAHLRALAATGSKSRVFLNLEDQAEGDRGPALMRLQARLAEAGVHYALVYRAERPPPIETTP